MATSTVTRTARYTLRKGNEAIHFDHLSDGNVIVDEGDGLPVCDTATSARNVWTSYIGNGWKADEATQKALEAKKASQPAPVAPVTQKVAPVAPVVMASNAAQTEKDVDKAMGSSRDGLAGRYAKSAESKAYDMERVLRKLMSEGGLFLVNYYIPVELSTSGVDPVSGPYGIRISNPASSFRGIGIHLDGSNWLMTAEGLASEEVQDFFTNMDEHKSFQGREGESPAYWHTMLRQEEYEKFVNIAQNKFCAHVRKLHASLIECIANADEALATAMKSEEWTTLTAKQQETAQSYRNNRIRARIKNADKELADAIKCAEAFDMNENLTDLFAGLRAAIRSHRQAFNVFASEAGIKLA